jgi:flagellar hook-associated protein 1 FlgK
MGNLLTSLLNSSNALMVYNRALETTENNVTNANTPGYARQIQGLSALPFDPSAGLPGGVGSGPTESTRSAFAEQSVRDQQSQSGLHQQVASDLNQLQGFFDPSSDTGVSADVNNLINTFSQLSINPNDSVTRQAVLDQAKQVAVSFQHTYSGIAAAGTSVDGETRTAVDAVNRLAGQIADINANSRAAGAAGNDAGADASLNSDLEELSQWVDFKALQQPDGSVTVYVGGQTPLVIGDKTYAIQGDFSSPQTKLLNAQGTDITGQLTGGKLSGLLQVKNTNIPAYLQTLNTLAKSVADQVNTTLANGLDQNGNAPTTDLFTYDDTVGAAATMDVNNLSPSQLAAASPDSPGGNGNALALAALGTAAPVNGFTFAQFYGNLAGKVGKDISNAQNDQSVSQQLLNQAQTLRQQVSGVSLDEEATHLITFQRAYQATSKMLSILNDLTGTVIDLIQ